MEDYTDNIPPFYIGQEVICLRSIGCTNVPSSMVYKGKEYKVTSCTKPCCYWVITVGIKKYAKFIISVCNCNKERIIMDELEYNASAFAPKLKNEYKEVTFKEIECPIPCEN